MELLKLQDVYLISFIIEDQSEKLLSLIFLFIIFQTGDIFVNRGLLDFVLDQDQLAFVLAHEMAHSILNHSVSTGPCTFCT